MDSASRILVTGAAGGLGQALQRALGGIPFTRQHSVADLRQATAAPFDAIVHCAFGRQKTFTHATAYSYLNDSILLTEQLASVPHRKFIFVSTIDVYPNDGGLHSEDDEIDFSRAAGPYAFAKLFCEAVVRERTENHLILRPAAMLGPTMRPNNLVRMVRETGSSLTLTANSRINAILHRDVIEFVVFALDHDVTGVFNLSSVASVTLGEVAESFGISPRYGNFTYDAIDVDNVKAASLVPGFQRNSIDVITEYFRSAPKL